MLTNPWPTVDVSGLLDTSVILRPLDWFLGITFVCQQ